MKFLILEHLMLFFIYFKFTFLGGFIMEEAINCHIITEYGIKNTEYLLTIPMCLSILNSLLLAPAS